LSGLFQFSAIFMLSFRARAVTAKIRPIAQHACSRTGRSCPPRRKQAEDAHRDDHHVVVPSLLSTRAQPPCASPSGHRSESGEFLPLPTHCRINCQKTSTRFIPAALTGRSSPFAIIAFDAMLPFLCAGPGGRILIQSGINLAGRRDSNPKFGFWDRQFSR